MRYLLQFLIPISLAATQLPPTMLSQAAEIARTFAPLVAKRPPPSPVPKTDALLQHTNNWLTIDLTRIAPAPTQLAALNQEALWQQLADIGFDGVELIPLKSTTSLSLDPRFGSFEDYRSLATLVLAKGVQLVGPLLGDTTGKGLDFALGLKNVGEYPQLYGLIEIAPEDWPLLPKQTPNVLSTNVPWLTLQTLHKKGYVPVDFDPYVKQSHWDATQAIACEDHVVRRWIFRRNASGLPKLDWINASFGAERLLVADALQSIYRLNQTVVQLDGLAPQNALVTMSLNVRKLGAFTALKTPRELSAIAACPADVCYDPFTPIAVLHALVAGSSDTLSQIYQRFLDEGIQLNRLVHALTQMSHVPCDLAALFAGGKGFLYEDEADTDAALKQRLLKEDLSQLDAPYTRGSSWSEKCEAVANRIGENSLSLQVLLIRFFAWQPGVFSLSLEDLLGASTNQGLLNPGGVNADVLYPSLPLQLKNSNSCASSLQEALRLRRKLKVESAELIEVVTAENSEVLLLRYQLSPSGNTALLALNVGKSQVSELIESPDYVGKAAIDASSGLALDKPVDSSLCRITLEKRSVRLIEFVPNPNVSTN